MPVGLDKARHDDHVGAVDDLDARCRDRAPYRHDRAIAHVHVADRQVERGGIHGEHMAATQDEFAQLGNGAT